jgi:hypothetical protein
LKCNRRHRRAFNRDVGESYLCFKINLGNSFEGDYGGDKEISNFTVTGLQERDKDVLKWSNTSGNGEKLVNSRDILNIREARLVNGSDIEDRRKSRLQRSCSE